MKKIILLLLTYALVLNTAHAQAPKYNSLLWEVSGNGLKASSYLFGTYHLAGKSFADSLSYIKTYFDQCRAVAGEVVLDSMSTEKIGMAMILPDTITLDKIFTADEYKLLVDYVQQTVHTDLKNFNRFNPAAVGIIVSAAVAPNTSSETNPALDMYFQQEGKRRNIKVLGLETVEDQIDLMFNVPLAEQKTDLLKDIRKKDKAKKVAAELYSLYLKQDLDGLGKLIAANDDDTPEQTEKGLYKRNRTWIAELPAIMKAQPTFIAVGAAHLVGQYGLIDQLRLKGYTVKAVKI